MVIGRASSTWRSSGVMAGILWDGVRRRKQTRRGVAWFATPRRAAGRQRYVSAASTASGPLRGLLRAALLGSRLLRGRLLRGRLLRRRLLRHRPLACRLLRGRVLGGGLLGGRLARAALLGSR